MSGTVILNIVIVLGIIIAGGFLIFFMGDLLLSIINPKKDKEALKAKKEREEDKLKEEISKLSPESAEEVKKIPEVASIVYGGAVVEAYNPEEEEKTEETMEEAQVEEPVEEQEEDTEVETEETEETEDDRDAYIAQRRRELMERLARIAEEEEVEEEEEDEEEEEVEEVTEEPVEEVAEPVEDNSELDATKKALEEANARNAALMAEFNALKAQMANQPAEVKPVEEVLLSEEDYLARLAEQEDALKANEKELRACKKEFMPLRRVKKTLENDEKKLRRKEALVAKQKVVLYGVNNYADIDEEKAKKLAEDLDLLDGLKLSVEHCQEVMNKNEERYPLLEKMYDILNSQNAELKASIERTKAELAKVRAKKDEPAD